MAVAVGRPANEDLRNLALSGHVGFDSLPDQLVNKSTSQGFCFNILCVGETGIGKSTLMDTLFNTKFESDPATHKEPGVRLKARSYELQESNVRLKLTIVDTVGFGDQINKDDRVGDVNKCIKPGHQGTIPACWEKSFEKQCRCLQDKRKDRQTDRKREREISCPKGKKYLAIYCLWVTVHLI